MARKDQFIKSKTDFVLRKKHAVTSVGTIYENDHMTIVPEDGVYNDEITMFSDSNFKFRVRTDINNKKKHFSGSWVKPSNGEGDYWTYNSSSETITTETKIQLKPNYSSLKDFAYYGSAEELIKATVRDIILRFPGGICYLGREDEVEFTTVSGEKYWKVSNEVGIDILTPNGDVGSVENPLRVLSASLDKYVVGESMEPITSFSVTSGDSTDCLNTIVAKTQINNITLYTFLSETGEKITVVKNRPSQAKGTPIIWLKKNEFDKAYDALDDFEKVLLPLDTNPPFKAIFETPYFNGQDYHAAKKEYEWPSLSSRCGFITPDLTSSLYGGYLSSLINAARFHDEIDSDNLWRMMTHTSLKNLDWTFMRIEDGEAEDMSDFDTSRLKAAIELYGRSFDDIKRYADNIKYSNTITYDEKNNIPDYFISDSVENDGWEAQHIGPTNDESIITTVLFSGSSISGGSSSDANLFFLRALSINSDYIQSLKGTRKGLEVIMSLFGLKNGEDYKISEYIAAASKFPSEHDVWAAAGRKDGYYYDDDIFADWPVLIAEPSSGNGANYAIPWFDKHMKYDSSLYFQQKGGWENVQKKHISLPITTFDTLFPNGSVDIFGDTLPYMRFAENLNELTALTTTKLFPECVCYVGDISGIEAMYNGDLDDQASISNGSTFSHYFILKNEALSANIGYVDNEYYKCYGWRNVFSEEFDGSGPITCDGTRVLYCESIKSIENGNNPHVGFGEYDMGEDYLDHFRQIFKYEIENGMFSRVQEDDDDFSLDDIKNIGFGPCERKEVTRKTVMFRDDEGVDSGLRGIGVSDDEDYWGDEIYDLLTHPESGNSMDEAAAWSVINVKNIEIDFHTNKNQYFEEYIENVVMRYIEQMMPSTAIFSYKFDSANADATPDMYASRRGGLSATGDAVQVDGDNTFIFEHPLPQIAEE